MCRLRPGVLWVNAIVTCVGDRQSRQMKEVVGIWCGYGEDQRGRDRELDVTGFGLDAGLDNAMIRGD